MPEVIPGITCEFGKTNRNTFFNHSSSAPSRSTVSLLTITANYISKTNTDLPHFGKADFHGKKQVVMVGQQSGILQWPTGYTTTGTGPYSDRCIQKRMGGTCQGIRTGGQWSKKEQDLQINQLELLAIKFAISTFPKMWKMLAIHIQVYNMTALSYLLKMGRTKNQELMQISYDYCRPFTREYQLQGRLGITALERVLRMETVPSKFQQNMPNIGEETRNRPVCFKVVKSTSKLLLLEAGSQQSWHTCSSTEMVSQESICISCICLDSQSNEKSR